MRIIFLAFLAIPAFAQAITPTGNFLILDGGYHTWNHVPIQGTFQVVCTDIHGNPVQMRTRYLSPTITIIGPNLLPAITINCAAVFGGGGGSPATFAQKFFGTADPGAVTGNLPGDFFSDYVNHRAFQCNAPPGTPTPACTSVSPSGWLLLNGGGSSSLSWSTLTSPQWATLTSSQWSTLSQ